MPSGEDDLIARHFRPLARHGGALSLTDDAALLTPRAGQELVLTTDAIVAGVHFISEDAPAAIARKALRVNLSDLAAKGAEPLGFLLTLALPPDTDDSWLAIFAEGLSADAVSFACPLLGGDTVRTPGPLTVSITALGSVSAGKMVKRQGARAGDRVFVTGTIGDAALGLKLRQDATWKLAAEHREFLAERYLLPQPRNALAAAVRDHASAAMDVSDGLAGDLAKLCRVSGVSAEIDAAQVPLSPAAQSVLSADSAAMETILTGGDDYEIVCTVPAAKAASFKEAAQSAKVKISDIGGITGGNAPPRFTLNGEALQFTRASFSHF